MRKETKMSRASFVKTLPITLSVEEVIARGKAAGLTIQRSDVHSQRFKMRQDAWSDPVPESKPDTVKVLVPEVPRRAVDPEEMLRRVASRLGTVRARAIIDSLEAV